jgi:peptidoglycan/xylan/chitin deacetylase (PgdA/CDA1 family)
LDSSSPLLSERIRAVIVTHDVDWPRKGPGLSHILARQTRFDPEIIRKVTDEGFNPYYGVPVVKEIEERFNIRSTFFFRPEYDDGSSVQQYEDTIKELVKNGWEVGLHVNSTSTIKEIVSQKKSLERTFKGPVYGSRVHYLKISENTFSNLTKAGLKYDSSLTYSKEIIDPRNSDYLRKNGLIVFPVTFMDAYLFTYMGLTEKTITKFILKNLERLFVAGVRIVTLLWHDNSIMMKGGRAYSILINQMASNSDVVFLKGIEAFELVQKGRIERVKDR